MKDWYSLALGAFLDQASICIELNQTWRLEYSLKDLIYCMEKVIEKGDTITPNRKSDIELLLTKLPANYKVEANKIKGLTTKIIIKEIILPTKIFGMNTLSSIFGSKK